MSAPFSFAAADPPPFELCCIEGKAPILLTCDHASRIVPKALDNLGLADAVIARHIGWDIGAAAVTRKLAPLLDAPAVLGGYSRLVIDCNRDPEDASSIPTASDGVPIPGNIDIAASEKLARRAAIFDPYHAEITARIAARLRCGIAPAVISIHSFTPEMKGRPRPWHVGVLWDKDGRIAVPLLAALRAEAGLVVGDNEPYSAREPVGYTQRHHAFARGLPHVAIELRQDLITAERSAAAWAERLARVLKPVLAAPSLYVAIAPPPPHSQETNWRTSMDTKIDDNTRTELEAAAFRRLVQHLRERTDVQNLDLMNLAGFCRNCLSRWYREAAEERGMKLPDPAAREIVYGMPYEEWKQKHQKEPTKPVEGGGHKH